MFHTADILVILAIVIGVLLAIWNLIRNRKDGRGCMGCPHSGNCSKQTCSEKKKE